MCLIPTGTHSGNWVASHATLFHQKNENTVNSRLADTMLFIRTLNLTDKIQIPIYRGLPENDSRYYAIPETK